MTDLSELIEKRRRPSPIEILAREICWRGFSGSYRPAEGKVAYWQRVTGEARERYMRDAEYLAWLWRKSRSNAEFAHMLERAASSRKDGGNNG